MTWWFAAVMSAQVAHATPSGALAPTAAASATPAATDPVDVGDAVDIGDAEGPVSASDARSVRILYTGDRGGIGLHADGGQAGGNEL